MKCVICKKGRTKLGTATVTLDKDGATLVFKSVRLVCAPSAAKRMWMEISPKDFSSPRKKPRVLEFRSKSASIAPHNPLRVPLFRSAKLLLCN
jgi:hypothetical protein